jgi:hypothetical protein
MEDKVNEIANRLRNEPYRLLTNNCLHKSIRFAKLCKEQGISAKVVLCLGVASARLVGSKTRIPVPVVHCWGSVRDMRIEVSHPLGTEAIAGIVPSQIRPIIRLSI